ncbi:MAG: glutathione S-transferase family protein [Gammaproteobacteria bacterium]|jgi:glutathione S-transferase|nr:glutathione S-transferase family protein [Gammaproteobacteria bacterium]
MIKLYGGIASPYVARVVLYAKLKGVDLPLSDPPGGMAGLKSPAYLKLNPMGKMPTLEVDGQGIGESSIICDYLDDVYPQKSGLPADALGRARSRLVARIADLYLAPHVGPLFRHMNPEKRDQAAVDAAAKEIAKAYGYLEQVMDSGPFCVGNSPTLGDAALGTMTAMLHAMLAAGNFTIADPVGSGRLATWWKAVQDDAVCGPVIREHGTAFGGFLKMMTGRK